MDTTRRKGSLERPYRTRLEQLEPLRASCDCRDFVRNSLGLCKHVLAVLAERSVAGPGGGRPRAPRSRDKARHRLTWTPSAL